jgi:hypothetical protein
LQISALSGRLLPPIRDALGQNHDRAQNSTTVLIKTDFVQKLRVRGVIQSPLAMLT